MIKSRLDNSYFLKSEIHNNDIMKIAFTVAVLASVLLIASANEIYAADFVVNDQASCEALGGTFLVSVAADGCFLGTLTVNSGDTFTLENLFIQIGAGGFTNAGSVTLIGGVEQNSGAFSLSQGANVLNDCGGTITAQGGDALNSGRISTADSGETITNFGTINLNGGDGQRSGQLTLFDTNALNDHGTINENPGNGFQTGIVEVIGNAVYNQNLPSQCMVGGEFLSIDSAALLVSGFQTNLYMIIPAVVVAAGASVFLFKRRSDNS